MYLNKNQYRIFFNFFVKQPYNFILLFLLLSVCILYYSYYFDINIINISIAKGMSFYHKIESNPTEKNNFIWYQNYSLGISIQYPNKWIKTSYSPSEGNRLVTFSNNGYPFIRVIVGIENLDSNMTSLDYTHKQINKLSIFNNSNNVFNITSLAHKPANEIVYRSYQPYIIPGGQLKNMKIWTIVNNKAYSIQYTTDPSNYYSYLPIVKKMVATFEILK